MLNDIKKHFTFSVSVLHDSGIFAFLTYWVWTILILPIFLFCLPFKLLNDWSKSWFK